MPPQVEKKAPNMEKIAKQSLYKNIISKGGVHWRPQGDHGHPQERGEAYIVPAGGGQGYALPWKKLLLYAGYFYYFNVGAFLLRFSLHWGSQGTDARTNVCREGGGGGWASPKKYHHKNIKSPPPHTIKKGPHMEKKSLKNPICMEIKIAKGLHKLHGKRDPDACAGGGGQVACPPPLEIKKQKKVINHQS